MESKKYKLVTHNGRFHADDIFACAVLQILLDAENAEYEIIRTRDTNIISGGDFVFDVGGEYDPARKRFDHHQEGRAGARENGVYYSSLGLIWKEYGSKIAGSKEAADLIEHSLVESIDAGDNGIETYQSIEGRPLPILIQSVFSNFMPTWKEEVGMTYDSFITLAGWAKEIMLREIKNAQDLLEASKAMDEIYTTTPDKRLLILDKRYPWEMLTLKYPEPLYVIVQPAGGDWKLEAVFVKEGTFERRAYLPEAWAGKIGEEMGKASGVSDAIFCHNGRQLAIAKSKEGVLALAKLALEA